MWTDPPTHGYTQRRINLHDTIDHHEDDLLYCAEHSKKWREVAEASMGTDFDEWLLDAEIDNCQLAFFGELYRSVLSVAARMEVGLRRFARDEEAFARLVPCDHDPAVAEMKKTIVRDLVDDCCEQLVAEVLGESEV